MWECCKLIDFPLRVFSFCFLKSQNIYITNDFVYLTKHRRNLRKKIVFVNGHLNFTEIIYGNHEIKSMQGDPNTYITSSLKSMELSKFKTTCL